MVLGDSSFMSRLLEKITMITKAKEKRVGL